MPEQDTVRRAEQDKRQGKAKTTQAGEFVREEIHHIREGKHGARSPKQAIAIGLSKARRAGVKLPPPPPGSEAARKARHGKKRRPQSRPSAKRGRSIARALRREPRRTASRKAL